MSPVDRHNLPVVPAEPSAFVFPTVRRNELANGLSVRTIEHRAVPVVTATVLFPTGAAADPMERPGLAALTADLLDESSGSRSTLEFHRALDDIGGRCEIDVGYDATTVKLTTLSRFREHGLALLADMVARPALRDDDFARVRELRQHRLLQLREQPAATAERAFAWLLFGNRPYGHLTIGTDASLAAVTVDDVRAFYRRRLTPRGATLVVVGDGTHDELARSASDAFESWGASASPEVVATSASARALASEDRSRAGRLFVAHRPEAAQSELRVGHVGVARDTPDFHALLVLNAILGGQFVSRINSNLREEKGITYGATSTFEFRLAPGPFAVQTSVDTAATAQAIGEIVAEIGAIRAARPPTDDEVTSAKGALTRGFARGFETASHLANRLCQMVLYGLADDYFSRFTPAVLDVTREAVRSVAVAHLDPERLQTVIVGDRERIADSLTTLGMGSPIDYTDGPT